MAAFLLLGSMAVGEETKTFTPPQITISEITYLPGDVVHIVIEAPLDTTQVKAIMPDAEILELAYNRQVNFWHGYWEIPLKFKKGSYNAKLVAMDVSGKVFEGLSSSFYIGEPTMALMVSLSKTSEAMSRSEQAPQRATRVEKEIVEEEEVVEEEIVQEKKTAAEPIVKAISKPKEYKVSTNITKVKLMIAARSYMSLFDYKRAREEIRSLLAIDPANITAQKMAARLDTVIRSEESKK